MQAGLFDEPQRRPRLVKNSHVHVDTYAQGLVCGIFLYSDGRGGAIVDIDGERIVVSLARVHPVRAHATDPGA